MLAYSNVFLSIYDFSVFCYLPLNNFVLLLFLDSCTALNPALGAISPLFTLLPMFFPFCLPSCFLNIFPPLQKLRYFSHTPLFFLLSPFKLILFFPFFPLISPALCCLLPPVNGQSLSFTTIHYFCWLPGRQTGSALGVSSAYNYLCREENVHSTRTATL